MVHDPHWFGADMHKIFLTLGVDEKCTKPSLKIREHEFRGPDSTNHQGKLFKRKGIWKRCLGGAHRVHFEHSLLHDSVTTIRVAPG